MATQKQPVITRRGLIAGGLMGGAALATGAYFGVQASNDLEVSHVDVKLPDWTAGEFRVVIASDLHINDSKSQARALHALSLAASTQSDLIVLLGDFIDYGSSVPLLEAALEPLCGARQKVVGVLGNHDYGSGHNTAIGKMLERAKVQLLVNDVADLNGVTIAGLDDALRGMPDQQSVLQTPMARSNLVLWHEPDSVDQLRVPACMQLSGHSHGGQVCLPGMILHTPLGAKKYRSGLYGHPHCTLYVNRGIGTTGPDWRLFCPPELTVLTISGS